MSEPIHHILDTTRLGAIRLTLCKAEWPRDDIHLGQQVQICQKCLDERARRRSRR